MVTILKPKLFGNIETSSKDITGRYCKEVQDLPNGEIMIKENLFECDQKVEQTYQDEIPYYDFHSSITRKAAKIGIAFVIQEYEFMA